MSLRGRGGGHRRGRGVKAQTWRWQEGYEASEEVYNSLFHIRKAPPLILQTLPNECPIKNAETRILERRQTEDGFSRNYYRVLIRAHMSKTRAEGGDDEDHTDGKGGRGTERIKEVDMSRILRYVSQRELERFENTEFRKESEAEAVARRAEADERAMKRLERNARTLTISHGSRSPTLLGMGEVRSLRRRGRLPGRGRGRGRSSWLQMAQKFTDVREDVAVLQNVMEEEQSFIDMHVDVSTEDEDVLRRVVVESDEEEQELLSRATQSSPDLMRSSFITNSALPVSPTVHRRRTDIPDRTEFTDEDGSSASSAEQQLLYERQWYKRPSSVSEEDQPQYKRQRTESRGSLQRPSVDQIARSGPEPRPIQHKLVHLASSGAPEVDVDDDEEDEDDDMSDSIPAMPPSLSFSKAVPDTKYGQIIDPEEPVEGDGEEYVIEDILDHSYQDGILYYLVKWEGYGDATDWLPEYDLEGASELVAEYNDLVRRRKGKARR